MKLPMLRRWMLALAAMAPLAGVRGQTPPSAPAPAPNRMKDIRYVVLHRPGPQWQAGKSMFEQSGLDAHVAHYRQWLEQGKLVLGGPHLDAGGGGMMVPEAGLAELEVSAFAQADPAVRSGLLVAEVRPWLIGMRKA